MCWFLRSAAMLLLAALCAASPAVADEQAQAARARALAAMQSTDLEERLDAVRVLSEIGRPEDLPPLMGALYDSDDQVRQLAESAVWRVWSRSGDAGADHLLEQGVGQMQTGQLDLALRTFSRAIELRPDFAEAWNKRATVYFLLGEDDLSLKDCDEVLKRNPRHFGVLAGYGQIYLRKGNLARALDYFQRALAINPNMDGVRSLIEAVERALGERRRRFI
jgi:Flp pilus assembly protein TadD